MGLLDGATRFSWPVIRGWISAGGGPANWWSRVSKRTVLAVIVLALAASTAQAVPTSVPRDPAAPPTGLGRLFGQEARFTLSCALTSTSPASATVGFSSTYPHRQVSYIDSGGTWSSWTTLAADAASYDCTGPCLHTTARVRIRGCDMAACTGQVEECTARIGVEPDGPPDLVWSGVETLSVGALGCVQTDATEVVVRLRYAGSHPGAGFPTVGGAAAAERTAERTTDGAAFLRTYTVAPGWTADDRDNGQWSFTVALDAGGSREATARVDLREHCLNPPQASVVGAGGTLAPIATGQMFTGGSELELSTGNAPAIYTLTGHELTHDGTVEPFGRVTIAAGAADAQHTWFESATGRDALTYRSPDLELTAQAPPCKSSGYAFWLDPSRATVQLPHSTDWTAGPTIRTDACAGMPAPGGYIRNYSLRSEVEVEAGSVATGWPVSNSCTTGTRS